VIQHRHLFLNIYLSLAGKTLAAVDAVESVGNGITALPLSKPCGEPRFPVG
jgi:hypothetical protein